MAPTSFAPPKPSEYYGPVLNFLLGRNGVTKLTAGILGTTTLAYSVFHRVSSTAVRFSLISLISLPVVAVGGMVYTMGRRLAKNRQDAFPEAKDELLDRIKSKRAIQKEAYDLYLPDDNQTTKTKIGLIFLPGALIEATAYAVLASRLSDLGILVAVLHLEPLRLAVEETVGQDDIQAIVMDNSDIQEWAIGGHSLGGVRSCELCSELKSFSKLVVWAGRKPKNCHLRKDTSSLLLVGSEDGLFWSREKQDSYQGYPDENSRYHMIPGGNHAGFAHYGPQNHDRERTITLEEQQDAILNETAKFLLG